MADVSHGNVGLEKGNVVWMDIGTAACTPPTYCDTSRTEAKSLEVPRRQIQNLNKVTMVLLDHEMGPWNTDETITGSQAENQHFRTCRTYKVIEKEGDGSKGSVGSVSAHKLIHDLQSEGMHTSLQDACNGQPCQLNQLKQSGVGKDAEKGTCDPGPLSSSGNEGTQQTSFLEICLVEISDETKNQGRIQNELKKKVYKCEKCGKTYSRKVSLTNHLKSFHGGFRYQCTQCSGSYAYKFGLYQHKKIHAKGIPLIKCKLCGLAVVSELSLYLHWARFHSGTANGKNTQKRIEGTGNHVGSPAKAKEIQHICLHCETLFGYGGSLRYHLHEKHGIVELGHNLKDRVTQKQFK